MRGSGQSRRCVIWVIVTRTMEVPEIRIIYHIVFGSKTHEASTKELKRLQVTGRLCLITFEDGGKPTSPLWRSLHEVWKNKDRNTRQSIEAR